MADSTLAFSTFGSGKTIIATDATAGVHTIKVTTDSPTDGIAIWGAGATKYVIGTVADSGVHTLCATTDAANSSILIDSFGMGASRIATVLTDGVHVLCVTTDAANAAVLVDTFGMGATAFATVLSDGVHVLAVTDTPDNGFAVGSFGTGKSVIAAAKSGIVYSLALNGLAPPYVGPLDYRPGALGAAGTIKLYSAYAGKALRVRNPDTNVESDIDFTAAGVLDSAQIAAAKGASTTLPVTTLYAQDGSGNDYIQTTSSKQPLLDQSGPNSGWAVTFDGVDDCLRATFSHSQPYVRYAAFNPVTSAGAGHDVFDGSQNNAIMQGDGTPNEYRLYAGSFATNVTFPAATWSISTNLYNGASSALRRNKLTASTGNAGSSATTYSTIADRGDEAGVCANISLMAIFWYLAADDTTAQDAAIGAIAAAVGVSV